ncbi:ABC transporter ATP-binding protein [Curtobacterium sp. 9128]|uniref:ABC transporter ATP-binding protein n=1 Tax=Curtobacterium sp. 9128 TaxID=1793722 RepID=UPI001642BE10|nr:ABC transporter ATP-binding protein [Curtobacterium sp. 9128]
MNTAAEEPAEAVLRVRQISKRYRKDVALQELDLEIPAGEIHGLLGSNGSGKTTALHMITGILSADSGTVQHMGIPLAETASRLQFGFAPDDLPLPLGLTGSEFLQLHDAFRDRRDFSRAEEYAGVFGVRDALSRPMAAYSHGMKRKLQLVAALMHEPSLLILDEPFRGLDPQTSGVLEDAITFFTAAGGSVLMATHDLLRAQHHCDSLTILHRGHKVVSGAPKALIHEYGSLHACFTSSTGTQVEADRRRDTLRALLVER